MQSMSDICTRKVLVRGWQLHPYGWLVYMLFTWYKLAWSCWTSCPTLQFHCLCSRHFSSFESYDPARSWPNLLQRWHFTTVSLCISGQLTDWWCFNDIIKPMIYVNVQQNRHNWDKCQPVTCSGDTLPWSEIGPLCACFIFKWRTMNKISDLHRKCYSQEKLTKLLQTSTASNNPPPLLHSHLLRPFSPLDNVLLLPATLSCIL